MKYTLTITGRDQVKDKYDVTLQHDKNILKRTTENLQSAIEEIHKYLIKALKIKVAVTDKLLHDLYFNENLSNRVMVYSPKRSTKTKAIYEIDSKEFTQACKSHALAESVGAI